MTNKCLAVVCVCTMLLCSRCAFAQQSKATDFERDVLPLLENYCIDCHSTEEASGNLRLDNVRPNETTVDPAQWHRVLKNLRAGIMPPIDSPKPTPDELSSLEQWIKSEAFKSNADNPNPGRVTLRRLNRVEYRNAIRDLLGFDFDAEHKLPPDDVGYGFDNIGDVLSISPIRLEKFIEAAISIVEEGTPQDTLEIPSQDFLPEDFVDEDGRDADAISFYQSRTVRRAITVPGDGEYLIHVYVKVDGDPFPKDPQECLVRGTADGKEFFKEQYQWADNNWLEYDCYVTLTKGEHDIAFSTEPVHSELQRLRSKMDFRMVSVRVDGPLDRQQWTHPPGYELIYSREVPPTDYAERRKYTSEVLRRFASKSFRRPVSEGTLAKLVALAEATYSLEGKTFEQGIGQAIVAILSSPKFLFHFEQSDAASDIAEIDEYSLAARLSFALWRSIPDDELTELASRGELRSNFEAQVKRMIADPKSGAFVEGFSHQWLQTNAIVDIAINSEAIMELEATESEVQQRDGSAMARGREFGAGPGARRFGFGFRRGRPPYDGKALTPEVRQAMKLEVEAYFDYIMREDRSVLEFLDSDYVFANADLSKLYQLPDIEGSELRKIQLQTNNPRGGVLTMGSVLTVTSNPTRTSPVKRGRWVLENILGAPSAPAPPDIPALEETIEEAGDRQLTQRQALEIHRVDPLCASCHARMDPLGLALENFNGFGRFRTIENELNIEPSGELVTGESFDGIVGLKEALVENHKMEFYRLLTEKLLIYMTGRGMEYYDAATIDAIADNMDENNGRFSVLLMGVLNSAPFHSRLPTNAVE
ncbi:MAG: DUF1592 domain-containing protein [Planctomycetales bacterium]|nr:DUF1592 domain-containing protein [Planctomycetales bacterium]